MAFRPPIFCISSRIFCWSSAYFSRISCIFGPIFCISRHRPRAPPRNRMQRRPQHHHQQHDRQAVVPHQVVEELQHRHQEPAQVLDARHRHVAARRRPCDQTRQVQRAVHPRQQGIVLRAGVDGVLVDDRLALFGHQFLGDQAHLRHGLRGGAGAAGVPRGLGPGDKRPLGRGFLRDDDHREVLVHLGGPGHLGPGEVLRGRQRVPLLQIRRRNLVVAQVDRNRPAGPLADHGAGASAAARIDRHRRRPGQRVGHLLDRRVDRDKLHRHVHLVLRRGGGPGRRLGRQRRDPVRLADHEEGLAGLVLDVNRQGRLGRAGGRDRPPQDAREVDLGPLLDALEADADLGDRERRRGGRLDERHGRTLVGGFLPVGHGLEEPGPRKREVADGRALRVDLDPEVVARPRRCRNRGGWARRPRLQSRRRPSGPGPSDLQAVSARRWCRWRPTRRCRSPRVRPSRSAPRAAWAPTRSTPPRGASP